MTQDKKFKFHKLTPRIVDTAHPSYIAPKRALDEAYMDKEIKNIAITGIYGSGKSSFLKTYFESDNDNDKLIKVAIADFKEPVKVNKDEIKDKIKVAERQIINQILYQIPSSSIPLSKFKIKEKRKWWRLLFTTLCLMAFIIGIFSLFNSSLIEFFYSDFLQVKEPSKWINITIMLCLMIPLLVTSVWLSKRASFKLTRFNFKGAETEIIEDENLDLLDHEAREIVYLILASGVETIIFEDLDRFEDISLFVRLREINSLVNYKSKETVRFIYVIRDGLFESKDRTKFFDLMIPVIPTITSYNSKGKLVDMFSDIENENLKLPPKLLAQISIYIDDMRMLYSIRNEYEIYSKSIDVDVFAEELFALVVLKNVFPKEFEDLENDSGYLYEILNKRDILIVEYEELLNNKIDEREELKQLLLTRVSDFLAVNIPPSYDLRTSQSIGSYMNSWYLNQEDSRYIYSGYGGQSYTFETFIEELCKKDSSLKERLNQVNNEDFKYKIDSLDKEISRIREEISRRHTAKTKNLLAELSEEELAIFFEEDNESYKDIIENHYYPLIRYLMLSGLVDENYWMYKGHFHEGYIGKNDNIFVNRLLTSKSIKNDFKLDNPEMVDSLLMDNDYCRKDIVNYDLMRMLIHKKKREKTICVLNVIEFTKDEEAIEHINQYDYKELRLLVDLLTESCFEDFYQFFQAGILTSNLRLKLAGLACENLVLKPNPEFKDYISNNSKILELNFFESKEAILNGLESMEIQLVDISELEVSIELAFIIIENRLFIVNLDNVLNLIYLTSEEEDISKEKILEKLFAYLDNTKLVRLKEYVYEHLEFLLDKYILKIKEIEKFSSSGEEVLIEILNANLDTRIKIDFIGIENTIVKNISRVDEDELLPSLFNRNLVLYSKENIENYYERMGEVKTIIDFVNENYKKEFPFEQEIYENILNCTDTEFSLFKLISKDLGIQLDQISHNLSTEKYIDLITKKILKLNKDNALALLNVGEEDLFVKYVESISEFESSEEILSVLVEDDILAKLTTTQVEGIINLNVLDYDCSIKLISNHNQEISLFAIEKADMTVRSYVLDNFFKLSDYTKLIYNFKNFDLWEEIIERLNSNLEDWSELNSNDLPMEFIDELLRNSNLAESRKLKLLESAIINKIHIKMWQKWIKSIDSIKEIHTVFDRKRPLIENSDQLLIANALDKAGLISISESNNINFRPSRYNELQDGRK